MPANGQQPTVIHPGMNAEMASRAGSYRDWCVFFDDFDRGYDTTNRWAVVEDAGAGTGDVMLDAANGILNVGCDGDDNDSCQVSSINEVWKFQTAKRLYFETRIKIAITGLVSIFVGLSDTVAADFLLDAGTGPDVATGYIGAGFFIEEADLDTWQFQTCNGAAGNSDADILAFTDDEYTILGFAYDYNDGVTAKVTPYAKTPTGAIIQYAEQNFTIASSAEMHALMTVKTHAGNEEDLKVDYLGVWSER